MALLRPCLKGEFELVSGHTGYGEDAPIVDILIKCDFARTRSPAQFALWRPTIVEMLFSAPALLREWAATHDFAGYDRHELKLPSSPDSNNKAGLNLVRGRHLASFTVWGQGATEWIVMDSDTGKEVVVEDASFKTPAEICFYLTSVIEALGRLSR